MNKRKITLICSSFPPEKGAAPTRMYHLAQLLLQYQYEVTVIAAMPNYPTGKIFEQYRDKKILQEDCDGITVVRHWLWPTHSSSKIKRALSLLSYSISLLFYAPKLLRLAQPDVILVSSPPFTTGFLGLLLAKKHDAQLVLNVSDLWPKSAYDLGFIRKGVLYQWLIKMEYKMYQMADAYSVQSQEIANHIGALHPNKPIFLYRNLQPTSPFANQERPNSIRQIVYAGLLGVAQGVLEIVRTIDFAHLGTELHIYGQGFELEQIQSFLAQHPHRGVWYKGSVPATEIPKILCQYHAMLVPLSTVIDGAVPSKIFNALANGLPILFCGTGEAAQIVEGYRLGFVAAPGDTKSLKENIKSLLALTSDEYNQLRTNCLDAAASIFNKSQQDAHFLNFLAKL